MRGEVVLLGARAQLVPYGLPSAVQIAILTWPLWAAARSPLMDSLMLCSLPSCRIMPQIPAFWGSGMELLRKMWSVFAMLSWGEYHRLWVPLALKRFAKIRYILNTFDKLVFLNSFPPLTHLNIPCRALFFPSWKNLFLHFSEGFSSELFCIMDWAKSECFVDDSCTVHNLQYTGFFIRWAGAGTAGVNTRKSVQKEKE